MAPPARVAALSLAVLLYIAAATASPQWLEEAAVKGKCMACPDNPLPGQTCCSPPSNPDPDPDQPKTCSDGSTCCECDDSVFGCLCPLAPAPPPPHGVKGILVAGDSWGTEGDWGFREMMRKHVPKTTQVTNIAVPGSTAADWESKEFLDLLVSYAKVSDYMWLSLMANDCAVYLPSCARGGLFHKGKSPEECGAELVTSVTKSMQNILDAIKAANPNIRVFGHGYDFLGWDMFPMGDFARRNMLPQCQNGEPAFNRTQAECVNTQFIKLQAVWESLAKQYDFIDVINVLGTLQVAGGNKKASVGHPDMSEYSPKRLMEFNSLHPTPRKGFPLIFDQQWKLYWSKKLGVERKAESLVV
eukprot:gnl/TRDRNA2_/TRDRNA2_157470_c0_seq2.p1 gnl/TRDRNA2_/TRDRNA2_157470_c0~~gnl/TRDRNA2_/TRDRNA2_157470_c0_seq2.p1  ORF type:complete len:366 (+),score=66.38 gnl/TRDRNA2_/TRDRNA2_157470_c0_seq2:25-1098(+)